MTVGGAALTVRTDVRCVLMARSHLASKGAKAAKLSGNSLASPPKRPENHAASRTRKNRSETDFSAMRKRIAWPLRALAALAQTT